MKGTSGHVNHKQEGRLLWESGILWAKNEIQWNLSIKETQKKGHLSNEDTVYGPDHIQLCTNLPLQ